MKLHTQEDLAAMAPGEFATLERRIKRVLGRRGVTLSRSRAKDRASPTFGKYLLVSSVNGEVLAGGYMEFLQVEKWLAEDDKRRGL
jgi:hypothetical protein